MKTIINSTGNVIIFLTSSVNQNKNCIYIAWKLRKCTKTNLVSLFRIFMFSWSFITSTSWWRSSRIMAQKARRNQNAMWTLSFKLIEPKSCFNAEFCIDYEILNSYSHVAVFVCISPQIHNYVWNIKIFILFNFFLDPINFNLQH